MDDSSKAQIVEQLRAMITGLAPDVTLKPMYGGTVIEMIEDDPKSRVGGFFVYDAYVSVEFANGVSFDDPTLVLEGKVKLRRHIKLRNVDEIETKGCENFLRQAML